MDKLTSERRSANMRQIRSKDMKPELAVRQITHHMGYRFRLHRKDLPGKPDLVFPKRHKVIFVHGCFWHLHPDENCKDSRIPKSRQEYWIPKLSRNVERDAQHLEQLKQMGWDVLIIWECQTKNPEKLAVIIKDFLDSKL